jgi:hypothetical protein
MGIAANFDDEELSGVFRSSVAERPLRFDVVTKEKRRKTGLHDHPVNVGYHRLERMAAAPGMRAWFEDKTSQWAKPLSMDERRRGGK